ncbi:hypothetical protein Rs2_35838 [Raphanus sativus]|nr:hypothetical protein Rs2_35838 [Raphanus sativus]
MLRYGTDAEGLSGYGFFKEDDVDLARTSWENQRFHKNLTILMNHLCIARFLALGIKAESGEETTKNDLFIGFNASDRPVKVILPTTLPDGRSKWREAIGGHSSSFPGVFLPCSRGADGWTGNVREMKPCTVVVPFFETINSTTA